MKYFVKLVDDVGVTLLALKGTEILFEKSVAKMRIK